MRLGQSFYAGNWMISCQQHGYSHTFSAGSIQQFKLGLDPVRCGPAFSTHTRMECDDSDAQDAVRCHRNNLVQTNRNSTMMDFQMVSMAERSISKRTLSIGSIRIFEVSDGFCIEFTARKNGMCLGTNSPVAVYQARRISQCSLHTYLS